MVDLAQVQRIHKSAAGAGRRRIHFVINADADSAELLEFLEALPRGTESAWWRGIAKRWIESAKECGLEAAVVEILNESSAQAWRCDSTPPCCSV